MEASDREQMVLRKEAWLFDSIRQAQRESLGSGRSLDKIREAAGA